MYHFSPQNKTSSKENDDEAVLWYRDISSPVSTLRHQVHSPALKMQLQMRYVVSSTITNRLRVEMYIQN